MKQPDTPSPVADFPTIGECLALAPQLVDSDSPRFDLELLLASVLERDRSYLFAWPERQLTGEQWQAFARLLQLRRQGHPVAHLLQRREFWGLQLEVDDCTLIPRPETEMLVELSLQLQLPPDSNVLDLGTGTGAIALALASERRRWQILGVDRSAAAVALAERNRQRLQLTNVSLRCSDWYAGAAGRRFELIVSNPPYVAAGDPHLSMGDLRFEPRAALVAGADGLDDLRFIVAHCPGFLTPGGWLLLEHGYDQAAAVCALLQRAGLTQVQTHADLGGQPRVSLGRMQAAREDRDEEDGE